MCLNTAKVSGFVGVHLIQREALANDKDSL